MPIKKIEPPAGLSAAVSATLDQLQPRSPLAGAEGLAAPGGAAAHAIGASIPLYFLRLDRIAAGDGLGAADPNGWRTDVGGPDGTVAVADAAVVDGGRIEVRQVSRGAAVQGLAEASADAEAASGDGDYEQRVLQIPGISLTAVWLHEGDAEKDVVIPSAPTPPGIEAARRYTAADFLAAVRPLAQARLDDDPSRASTGR
jgi:hypothetical protein